MPPAIRASLTGMSQRSLNVEILLRAYSAGVFPMADSRQGRKLYWVDPEWRGIIPLEGFHVPRRLRRTVRRGAFDVRCDTAFRAVIAACAEPAPGREDSWITAEIAVKRAREGGRRVAARGAEGAAPAVRGMLGRARWSRKGASVPQNRRGYGRRVPAFRAGASPICARYASRAGSRCARKAFTSVARSPFARAAIMPWCSRRACSR